LTTPPVRAPGGPRDTCRRLARPRHHPCAAHRSPAGPTAESKQLAEATQNHPQRPQQHPKTDMARHEGPLALHTGRRTPEPAAIPVGTSRRPRTAAPAKRGCSSGSFLFLAAVRASWRGRPPPIAPWSKPAPQLTTRRSATGET